MFAFGKKRFSAKLRYKLEMDDYPPAGCQNQQHTDRSPDYPPSYSESGYGSVIQEQPYANQPTPQVVASSWMPMPQNIPSNCPDGLQCLLTVNQLFVKQNLEHFEVLVGYEINNKYIIKNNIGQKMFYAVEENDGCTRICCGPGRPFEMRILDNLLNEIIHISRPLACQSCCFPCCLQKIEVFSPPGCLVGTVEQNWSICTPLFTIRNAANDEILNIKGPICQLSCMCNDIDFKILSKDKTTEVGLIAKQWSGFMREAITDADHFGITFPMNLDIRIKAVMIGACFLIDFMYFEKQRCT